MIATWYNSASTMESMCSFGWKRQTSPRNIDQSGSQSTRHVPNSSVNRELSRLMENASTSWSLMLRCDDHDDACSPPQSTTCSECLDLIDENLLNANRNFYSRLHRQPWRCLSRAGRSLSSLTGLERGSFGFSICPDRTCSRGNPFACSSRRSSPRPNQRSVA